MDEQPKSPPERKKPGPKGGRLFTVRHVEEALRVSGGICTAAANVLHCSPNTVANYIKRSPKLQQTVREIRESTLDLCEAGLIKLIQDRHPTAIIFWLKCQGKHRGWIERKELTGKDGAPLTESDVRKLSDEDLAKLAGRPAAAVAGHGGTGTAPSGEGPNEPTARLCN